MLLLGGILVIVASVVGLALFAGGGDDESELAAGECWSQNGRSGVKSYAAPPQMVIDENTDYSAVISTSKGNITVDLLEDEAPETVNNFVCLARDGFYDQLIWHRVEKDQVIQTGDPLGTGEGGPGYTIQDELPEGQDPYKFGVVGMANSGPDSGGSQFFIAAHDPDPKGGYESAGYPPSYPVFGRVSIDDSESVATIIAISSAKVQGGAGPSSTQPVKQIVLESVDINEG
jgi:cyclophilin family peptidyl-prolyl cis-trans isomerase